MKISKIKVDKIFKSYLNTFTWHKWKAKGHIRYVNVCRAAYAKAVSYQHRCRKQILTPK